MRMSYRVYVIRNEAGRRYIGLSADVGQRLVQHNNGESKWTAKHRPWFAEWQSVPLSLGEARRLENRMKKQKGGGGLELLMREWGERGS